MTAGPVHRDSRSTGVAIIGALKLAKALALIAIGVASFRLAHRDALEVIARWLAHFALDADDRRIHWLLVHVAKLDARRLEELGVGTFAYAAIALTEGLGLLFQKRWAEILTVAVTSSFLPLELWELTKKASFARLLAIAVNGAIVAYLIWRLRTTRRHGPRSSVGGDGRGSPA